MNRFTIAVCALATVLAGSDGAFAQGGGASSTGTIQGRVADSQGAVLPGVTVTATMAPTGVPIPVAQPSIKGPAPLPPEEQGLPG